MIRFENWTIQEDDELLARQFDNLTRALIVTGEIPAGWEWAVLVQVGEAMDIIPLTVTEGALSAVLTAQQLSIAGYYNMQLRATQGDKVKHTNTVNVYIPASLSGDEQWPTVPSEFSDMERRINEKAAQVEGYSAHPPMVGENGNWWVWDGEKYIDTGTRAKCEIDATLSVEGKAADAKATGEALDGKVAVNDGHVKNRLTVDNRIRIQKNGSTDLSMYSGDLSSSTRIISWSNLVDGMTLEDLLYPVTYARICYDRKTNRMGLKLPDRIVNGLDESGLAFNDIGNALELRPDGVFLVSVENELDENGYIASRYEVSSKFLHEKLIDTALELPGFVADAKATGDALKKKLDLSGGTVTGPIYYKSTSNQFLRTDNIVNWAITNVDEWAPFFGHFNIGRVQRMHYQGTGTYGSANPKTFSFDFEPKLVIIKRLRAAVPNVDGSETFTNFSDYIMFADRTETAALSGCTFSNPVKGYVTNLSWSGKSLSIWGSNSSRHLNEAGNFYVVLAIG